MSATKIGNAILNRFKDCRKKTIEICRNLQTEDYVVQPIEFVSPPKWHLGHTTWFFEKFILEKYLNGYQVFNDQYNYVFNSYYEAAGERVVRTQRGNLSRPTVEDIKQYRIYVNRYIQQLLMDENMDRRLRYLVEIGINHEQQHQELLYTDIKYILGHNPLLPTLGEGIKAKPFKEPQIWIDIPAGIYNIGYDGDGFCYDNEQKQHKVYLDAFSVRNALITNNEYLEFMDYGGYKDVTLWHSDGWQWLKCNGISAPQYWHLIGDKWMIYTFRGLVKLNPSAPVQHLSYYETSAFLEWKGWRLPTEQEWEISADHIQWGDLWEWTESAYLPYPGFEKEKGALGEYNGKFMVNQKVLRGSSFATSKGHSRKTYRNFFQPNTRWQFTGIRPVISHKL